VLGDQILERHRDRLADNGSAASWGELSQALRLGQPQVVVFGAAAASLLP
jgi:hypothetical protein